MKKIKDILKLVLSFITFFYISDISKYILGLFNVDFNKLGIKDVAIYQLIVSSLIFIIMLFLYYDTFKEDFIKYKKNPNDNIKKTIKYFIIFMIAKFGVSIISAIIMIIFNINTDAIVSVNQQLIEKYLKAAPILMLISSSILAPFYEEGLFRLGFKKIIHNKWLFIIISGALFGLLHIFPLDEGVSLTIGIIQSISYVTMGMFLSYIYYKTDNIYISIGVHLLNNFISMLVVI